MSEATLTRVQEIVGERTNTSPNMWQIVESRNEDGHEEHWLHSSTNKAVFIRLSNESVERFVVYGEPPKE